jgi:hypothetical protein
LFVPRAVQRILPTAARSRLHYRETPLPSMQYFLAQRQVHARSSENLMLFKFNARRHDADLFVMNIQ